MIAEHDFLGLIITKSKCISELGIRIPHSAPQDAFGVCSQDRDNFEGVRLGSIPCQYLVNLSFGSDQYLVNNLSICQYLGSIFPQMVEMRLLCVCLCSIYICLLMPSFPYISACRGDFFSK